MAISAVRQPQPTEQFYEYEETRALVDLVNDAVERVHQYGEEAFDEFRVSGSRWRQGETYIFVLDAAGDMRVHPDPLLEGKNQFGLKDLNGKPITQGLMNTAMENPDKPEGWYHYQWPVPGDIFPRWKSSYVRLITAPNGNRYVIGAGMYNDRMERAFVVDAVINAVKLLEETGTGAFRFFRDPTGPFIAKDAYIFVCDLNGVELLNTAFPNQEGRSLLDYKDTQGKLFMREMLQVIQTSGSGWVDYMWPKPGESVSTQKSAYVSKAKMGTRQVMVGCGVYLANAPKSTLEIAKMTAPDLMALVREAATVFEKEGENAYATFRAKDTKWFHDEVYFFVWTMNGTRVMHAADPSIEGQVVGDLKDILGRPLGKMILEIGASPSGEGWIHYMYPKPAAIFPTWKSTFVKRVTFPSGKQHIIGCGIYNMRMDKPFIEDVVNRAAALVEKEGTGAFNQLRDKKGPFFFMDTYLFIETPDGTEVLNGAYPSLEGRNLIQVRDGKGVAAVQHEISAALKQGSAWLEVHWLKPGTNRSARKLTYVRKAQAGRDTYIVGSGFYLD